jgi:hypothetical protein
LSRDQDDLTKPDETFFFQIRMHVFSSNQKPLFFSWLLTLFKVHYINTRRMFYFFNIEIETL